MAWPKGKPRKAIASTEVSDVTIDAENITSTVAPVEAVNPVTTSAKKAAAKVTADPHDKVLDHFQYTKDDHELDVWQHSDVSPLSVPADIHKNYPGMRWHWVSEAKLKRVGVGYQGWQIFADKSHPEGVKRGNDLRLAAMPEERASRYNEATRKESTERLISLQEQDIESSGVAAMRRAGSDVEIFGGGLSIDSSARKGNYAGRGLHPEEVRERIIKGREKQAKGRVYFT